MSEQHIELEGTISAVLPGTMFKVKLDNQHEVLAHISGKMRKHFLQLIFCGIEREVPHKQLTIHAITI